jgi:predicted transcriptional regulator
MSDFISNPSGNETSEPPKTMPKLDPVAVLFALGSEVRWPIIKRLADGRRLSITEAAAIVGRDVDGVSRQLKVLREAGLLEAFEGKDRRQTIYQIPAVFRPVPDVLDFGFCVLHLNQT